MAETTLVFVNYRRADSDADAQWLAQEIKTAFGEEQVFIDVEAIRGGEHFPGRILHALQGSRVLISVVGPDWFTTRDEVGGLRLENPDDWVRKELRDALNQPIPVIPVLVGGLSRESFSHWKLPDDIARFREMNAICIDQNARRWGHSQVVKRLEELGIVRQSGLLRPPFDPLSKGEPRGPASLLLSRYRVVPLFGREPELREVVAWCNDTCRVANVRLYVGPGGVGKTRFAAELCERLGEQGWITGFLDENVNAEPVDYDRLLTSGRSTLVVFDYAETRPDLVSKWIQWLSRREKSKQASGGLIRLVLLARHGGDWWNQIKSRGKGEVQEFFQGINPAREMGTNSVSLSVEQGRDSTVVFLTPLADTAGYRLAAFQQAARAFAAQLGRSCDALPPDLTKDHFQTILLVHLAALAAVEGVTLADANALLNHCLNRERTFWSERAAALLPPLRLDDGLMDEAMAVIVICGPTKDELRQVLALTDVPTSDRTSLARLAAESYLTQEAGVGAQASRQPILGVQPDLLGEALVAEVLRRQPGLLEKWLAGLTEERYLERCFTVLTRISRRHKNPLDPAEADSWIQATLSAVVTRIRDFARESGALPFLEVPTCSQGVNGAPPRLLSRWVSLHACVVRALLRQQPSLGDDDVMRLLNLSSSIEIDLSEICGIATWSHPIHSQRGRDDDPFFDNWMLREWQRVGLKQDEVVGMAQQLPMMELLARVDSHLEWAERQVWATRILVAEAELGIRPARDIEFNLPFLEQFLRSCSLFMRLLRERPHGERKGWVTECALVS